MKIQNTPAALPRDWPRADRADKPAKAEKFDQAVQAATAGTDTTPEATAAATRPNAPPGLERVLAKLEARVAEGASRGQAQALDRVSRNLARYHETQALVPEPVPGPTPTDATAPEAPPTEPAGPVNPVATTPAEDTVATEADTLTEANPSPVTSPSTSPEDELQTLLSSAEPDTPAT